MGVSAYVLLGWCRAAEGEGHSATTHRAKPGPGLRSSGVGASPPAPRTFIGRCQTAGGRAGRRSPQVKARSGQEPHVCGRFAPYAARLVQSSEAGGARPLPAGSGRSPGRAGAPRVWALWPTCCSAGAEQRGWRALNAAHPRRAKPGPGRRSSGEGASAYTLLGRRRAAAGGGRACGCSPPGEARSWLESRLCGRFAP